MDITVKDLEKSYDGRPVLERLSYAFQSGSIYCLMGASGAGKTTFFRILLGLEQPDRGIITGIENTKITAVFQENRLCESFSALDNVLMVFPRPDQKTRNRAIMELCKLLPEESIYRPVSTLSGGMKRRVAICRALACPFDGVLMDEPFTGLDEDTKKNTAAYIREKAAGKLCMISTHSEEDISLLGGQLIQLETMQKVRTSQM